MKQRVTTTFIKNVWVQKKNKNKHYDNYAVSFHDRIPETFEELLELCKALEEKTKTKKRYVYCTILGEIFVCLDDNFGKVGFCLNLKNIENPKRDIIHIKIIDFRQNILYNSFDISLSNSIDFIQSVLGVWIEYDN